MSELLSAKLSDISQASFSSSASKFQKGSILDAYARVREQSLMLIENLSPEDMQVQAMADASPTKWHLAHTSWFFETFILQHHAQAFRWFDESYCHLFNSYYNSVGSRHARPQRGFLTRPSIQDVLNYREHVDVQMVQLLERNAEDVDFLTVVGLHHEMQHQELMQTDILYLFFNNPLFPQIKTESWLTESLSKLDKPQTMNTINVKKFDGGLIDIGSPTNIPNNTTTLSDFSYDCESPKHRTYLHPYALNCRLITNAEWLSFMEDGGYQNSLLWLSDGWDYNNKAGWCSPLYWVKQDGEWFQFGLDGLNPVKRDAPVCHVSYYEADAFARWAGKRLPKEQELELASQDAPRKGNFLESNIWRPMPAGEPTDMAQLFGDVWEWTQSPFMPYPGFEPALGALGEYNGKFMANQYVLKGGSCVTPENQMRATYRNFFYPFHRWQFSGLRLAEDI